MKVFLSHILLISLFINKLTLAQLTVGDKAPNLVLSSTNNSIQSFTFPNQNKITLLFYWSTSVSKSKENIYKYKRLFSKYSDIGYKSCDGFDVISVALQSDKVSWENALKEYNLSQFNNCIAQKGYNDFFVKSYKLTETPSCFLIDELGKIIAINPSIKTIIEYLNEKRNSQLVIDTQSKLSGKIMFGNTSLVGLTNEKLWLLNEKNDTLQYTLLDDDGAFIFKNINPSISYNMYLKPSTKILEGQSVFLTSNNSDIVSNFKRTDAGYEYTVLDAEVPYLKPLVDNEPVVKKDSGELKHLFFTDIIFETKTSVLSKQAMTKLNVVVNKLKANPKTKIEIVTYTDSNGDTKTNTILSNKQSNAILSFLITKGINKTKLKATGKGEDEILNRCIDGIECSDDEHKLNRRTEFKFYNN